MRRSAIIEVGVFDAHGHFQGRRRAGRIRGDDLDEIDASGGCGPAHETRIADCHARGQTACAPRCRRVGRLHLILEILPLAVAEDGGGGGNDGDSHGDVLLDGCFAEF